jgi:O-acetylhomoserine/O-acetylserine sulfhydrylase-like pyridoxal-dependent enzyme
VIYSGLKSHPCYAEDKKYCPNGSAGLMRFHVPLIQTKDYSALEADRAPFVNAVSFGEAHTLMMCGYDGDTLVFKHEKSDKKDASHMKGYWYRLAIGLQSSDEVCASPQFFPSFVKNSHSRLVTDLPRLFEPICET